MTATPSSERHPVARLTEILGRLPRYLVLARALAGDPALAKWRKAALAASVVYLASPIDFVPGLIPVAGQLDDLAAVLLGLRVALGGLSAEAAAAHLAAAGLDEASIGRDLAIVRGAAGWLARRTASAAATVGRASVRAAAGATRLGLAGARKLAGLRRGGGAGRAGATARKPRASS